MPEASECGAEPRLLYLVRHAPSAAVAGHCSGQRDDPLSPAGLAAMVALARTWRAPAPSLIAASDLARARASAEVLARKLKSPIALDVRLRELDFGSWTGRSWDEIAGTEPESYRHWAEDWVQRAPPGGESFLDLMQRCRAWWDQARARAESGSVVVVAHAGSIRALLCILLELPPSAAFRFGMDPARVYAVRWSSQWAELCYGNAPAFWSDPGVER